MRKGGVCGREVYEKGKGSGKGRMLGERSMRKGGVLV